jgi:membrane protease YdiL (CAAX protease family)
MSFIRKHPLLCYFALTFAISWGGFLIAIRPDGFPGTPELFQARLPLAVLAMILGPSFAGLLLTALVFGRTGLRDYRARLLRWRVGLRWYATVLLLGPLLLLAVGLALSIRSAEFLPAILVTEDKAGLVQFGIAVALGAGIFEELGWTGFATPLLRRRFSVPATGLLLGLVWAAWHLLAALWGSSALSGPLVRTSYLLDPFLLLVAFRVLMVWVYDRTGSLPIAILMHLSLTGGARILVAPGLAGASLLSFDVAWLLVIGAVVAAVVLKDLMRSHPVAAYYGLVFAISWGGILIVILPTGIPGNTDEVARLMPFTLLALFAGPSIAGVVMTGLTGGKAGFGALFSRLNRWRVGFRWYAAALLLAPLLVTAVLLAFSLASPEYLPGILSAESKASLILLGIGMGLVGGGLLEELGWTGFVVPRLRLRHAAFPAALFVGVLWGVWHFLIAFWTGGAFAGDDWAAYAVGVLAFYLAALPAWRVLLVWLHDRSGSLLLVMLMHASLSASTLILQPTVTGPPFAAWNLAFAALLWAVVGAVAVTHRGSRLSHQPPLRTAT